MLLTFYEFTNSVVEGRLNSLLYLSSVQFTVLVSFVFLEMPWLQACDLEEDGLFSFDLHSDGDGRRYMLYLHLIMLSLKFTLLSLRNGTNLSLLLQASKCPFERK